MLGGDELMYVGLDLPFMLGDFQSAVWQLEKAEDFHSAVCQLEQID